MTTTHTRSTDTADPTGHRFPVAGRTSRTATDLAAPNARRFPAAGPVVGLVELPDVSALTLASPSEVDAHLAELEMARRKQLDALPSFNRDTVTAAYRATVEQLLADIRAARSRVAARTYGICTSCEREIPTERLEPRPWVAMCNPCARHEES